MWPDNLSSRHLILRWKNVAQGCAMLVSTVVPGFAAQNKDSNKNNAQLVIRVQVAAEVSTPTPSQHMLKDKDISFNLEPQSRGVDVIVEKKSLRDSKVPPEKGGSVLITTTYVLK
jgi:hypothetical protein